MDGGREHSELVAVDIASPPPFKGVELMIEGAIEVMDGLLVLRRERVVNEGLG